MARIIRKWKWPVIKVRTVLALVLVAGVTAGGWIESARTQRKTLAAIKVIDPGARFARGEDYLHRRGMFICGTGLLSARNLSLKERLSERFGPEYFSSVTALEITEPATLFAPGQRKELIRLACQLGGVQRLFICFPIDQDDLAQIGQLRSLRELGLEEGLIDPEGQVLSGLSDHPSLEILEISKAPLTDEGIASLGAPRHLRELSMNEGFVIRLDGPPGPTSIQGEGLARLGRCSELETLVIGSARLGEIALRNIGRIRSLEELTLSGGTYEDDDLEQLSGLKKLQRLHLKHAPIQGPGFRHLAGLPQLEYISTSKTDLQDEAVRPLSRLPALESLHLENVHISPEAILSLSKSPRLSHLDITAPSTAPAISLVDILGDLNERREADGSPRIVDPDEAIIQMMRDLDNVGVPQP